MPGLDGGVETPFTRETETVAGALVKPSDIATFALRFLMPSAHRGEGRVKLKGAWKSDRTYSASIPKITREIEVDEPDTDTVAATATSPVRVEPAPGSVTQTVTVYAPVDGELDAQAGSAEDGPAKERAPTTAPVTPTANGLRRAPRRKPLVPPSAMAGRADPTMPHRKI